jgi:hypothetical protein
VPGSTLSRIALLCLSSTLACTGTGVVQQGESREVPPVLVELPEERAEVPWRELPRASAADVAPPMRLTASDGTGLKLVSLRARAVVREPLAFTELHLVFDNPADRTMEGHFTIDMPKGAAISRFAMKIDDTWQEGEVVERQAARKTYESFLHRRQDPALLENEAGNRFSARVFPIPALARKELVISYSQALTDADEPYALALAGLPEIEEVDVEVAIETPQDPAARGRQPASRKLRHLEERAYTPREDLVVRTRGDDAPVGVRAGDLAVSRVIASGSMDAAPIDALTILFDTSGSRAIDYADRVRRLGALVAELREVADDPAFGLRVVAFDQDATLVFDGTADGFGAEQLAALYTRGAFGASDLEGALRRLGAAGPMSRVLVVTDGVATAGATEIASLAEATRALAASGAERIDAVVDGGLHDRDKLAAITTAGLERDGVVIDGTLDVSRIVAKLRRGTLDDITVSVPDATFVWPKVHRGLQAGDAMLVYAELPAASAMEVVLEGSDRITHQVVWTEGEAPLVERALAGARIAAMTAARSALPIADEAARAAAQRDIVTMSTKHRVISDFTAMLVLETQADYDRFGIRRDALADVLTVGDAGVEVIQRRDLTRGGIAFTDDRPRDAIPSMARNFDPDASSGILGSLVAQSGHFLAAPADAFAQGEASDDVWGALAGAEVDASFGVGGLGLVGTGRGGGGTGEGTIGTGNVGSRREARPGRRNRGVSQSFTVDPDRGTPPPVPTTAPPVAAPQPPPAERELREIMALVDTGRAHEALARAQAWHDRAPGDVLALVAMGEALERLGATRTAARVYGSIIDLFPSRADLRRFAGYRLDRTGDVGRAMAVDTYRAALAQRPDHPNSHRLYAWSLVRSGRTSDAFDAIMNGLRRPYPPSRFAGVETVLREDAQMIGAALVAKHPEQRARVVASLAAVRLGLAKSPSVRFVMSWETDANDVDLHVYDGRSDHAFFESPALASGGRLVDDVTTGYGPECFAIPGDASAFPYRFEAHYYSRGAMGYGMGTLQIVEHDGEGGFFFEDRPFVILEDRGKVDLGSLAAALSARDDDA